MFLLWKLNVVTSFLFLSVFESVKLFVVYMVFVVFQCLVSPYGFDTIYCAGHSTQLLRIVIVLNIIKLFIDRTHVFTSLLCTYNILHASNTIGME